MASVQTIEIPGAGQMGQILCIERHGRAHEREGDEAASLMAATQFRKTRDCGHHLAYLAEIPEPRVSVTSVSGYR